MPQDNTVASLDGQLELKKRARRRLVGAAALALLAAVVLPMVMDHEPRQPAQDVVERSRPAPRHDGAAERHEPAGFSCAAVREVPCDQRQAGSDP